MIRLQDIVFWWPEKETRSGTAVRVRETARCGQLRWAGIVPLLTVPVNILKKYPVLGFSLPGGALLVRHERSSAMAAGKKPGTNTGNGGGIFQQVSPAGKPQPNYVTVPDHKPLPPTTKPGHVWSPLKVTPDSKR